MAGQGVKQWFASVNTACKVAHEHLLFGILGVVHPLFVHLRWYRDFLW